VEEVKILIACEESQAVCIEMRKRGHEAYSCDTLPCSGGHPEWHIQGDVLEQLDKGWDMMIAHPPCTRLANSGVRWLKERDLWNDLADAIIFFQKLQRANIPKIAIENPIPHKYAVEGFTWVRNFFQNWSVNLGCQYDGGIGKYDQIIQPWQFGHGETKATCLWLKNLPKLEPTNIVEGREQRVWKMPPGADRAKERSKTFQGIAKAMAEQWG